MGLGSEGEDRRRAGSVAGASVLYPPHVEPTADVLALGRFLALFVRNPLRALPASVYEEPLVVYPYARGSRQIWVTGPALIERILLHEADSFPKTPLEKRVFESTLGNGILTSQGASWRWQRRTAAPMFRHQEILVHVPAMVAAAEQLLQAWRAGPSQATRYIDRDMTDVTFSVFASTLLSGADRADGEILKRAGAAYLSRISWEVASAMLRLPTWLWHPAKAQMRRSAAQMRAAASRIVAARRSAPDRDAQDILGRLLAARDPETGAPMSDEHVVDNLLTFIAAGHETTAKALTWTLYLLARAPDWQQRIREEVDVVCGRAPITAQHLEGLKTTQRVLKESMRLYPPAPVMTRMAARNVDLGGLRLEAGDLIVMPIYAIHRHKALWKDPNRFDPDRFLPEAEGHQLRTQFMPFGFGPRTCIGMAFAMIEATVLLATIVRGARFEWDGRHLPEPVSRVTLQPKGGMPLTVTTIGDQVG